MKISLRKITKFLSSLFSSSLDQAEIARLLRKDEAQIGGSLFGQANHRRDFFQLDEQTWVWNEEVADGTTSRVVTTRYTLSDKGILKSQDGAPHSYVFGAEFDHLCQAIRLYDSHVRRYYAQLQSSA